MQLVKKKILLIEDSEAERELIRKAFEVRAEEIVVDFVENGESALDYLHARGDYEGFKLPDVILLDLNLPGIDGESIIEDVKKSKECGKIPILVLSSVHEEKRINEVYKLKANAFIQKPLNKDDYKGMVSKISSFLLDATELPPIKE